MGQGIYFFFSFTFFNFLRLLLPVFIELSTFHRRYLCFSLVLFSSISPLFFFLGLCVFLIFWFSKLLSSISFIFRLIFPVFFLRLIWQFAVIIILFLCLTVSILCCFALMLAASVVSLVTSKRSALSPCDRVQHLI